MVKSKISNKINLNSTAKQNKSIRNRKQYLKKVAISNQAYINEIVSILEEVIGDSRDHEKLFIIDLRQTIFFKDQSIKYRQQLRNSETLTQIASKIKASISHHTSPRFMFERTPESTPKFTQICCDAIKIFFERTNPLEFSTIEKYLICTKDKKKIAQSK